jgi:glycosyltransferase involved in cell wall biosynthesis
MNILVVSSSAWLGGSELAMVETIETLKSHGHKVYVIYPWQGVMVERLKNVIDDHAIIYYKWWMQDTKVNFKYKLSYIKAQFISIFKIRAKIKEWNIDKVITSTLVHSAGAQAAKMAGVSHYWYIHELGQEDQNLDYINDSSSAYNLMRQSKRIIVNSKAVESKFSPILGKEKTDLLYYVCKVNGSPVQRQFLNRPLRLLMMSRMNPVKRQEDTIKALALLNNQDFSLTLCGHSHDTYTPYLEKLIADNNLSSQVQIRPFTQAVQEVQNSHDIMVICSSNEAFGRVTIEAMKQGLLVVAANTGGSTELIKHGVNGFFYEVHNAESLAQVLREIAAQPDKLPQIAKAGQDFALELCNETRHYETLIKILTY